MSRRLRRDEQAAFSHVESEWLGDASAPLWADAAYDDDDFAAAVNRLFNNHSNGASGPTN